MSKLEQLIQELCPDGVEYKALGELGYLYGGLSGKSKGDFTNGNAKLITYMNVYSNIAIDIEVEDLVKIGDNEKQNTVKYGDILFTGSSETPDECGMSSVLTKETEEKLYLNSFCFGFRFYDNNLLLPDFSKYLFRSQMIRKQIKRTASGVTRFNVSKGKMKKVVIPLPPLPVQRDIVRILDNFTELTAELTARKKQYEYYRNLLLTFGDDIEILKLEEVADIFDSLHQTPTYANEGFSMIRVTDVKGGYIDTTNTLKVDYETYLKFTQKYKPKHNDIVVSRVGSYGNFSLIGEDENCCLGQNTAIIHPRILSKFLYYYLCSKYVKTYIENNIKGGSQKTLSLKDIKSIPIAVPPIKEQARIVAILDRFDALCNDLTSDLPAEIEARQKQYEYYRDKLLTFKEVTA